MENTVTKVALDGTVLGTFPVGHRPAKLAFDGENIWVAYASYEVFPDGSEKEVPNRDTLTKLDLDGRELGTFHIEAMTADAERLGNVQSLAFDGTGIWVAHGTGVGAITKLALDGTELWTKWWGGTKEHLFFAQDRMVSLYPSLLRSPSMLTLDLEGNRLEYSELGGGQDSFLQAIGNIWDTAFGGDGIWLAGSCGVAKISMDGELVLGPFQTSVCGVTKKIIFDGEYIWVVENPSNRTSLVSRLNTDGQILGTFAVGFAAAGDLVFDGEGVWVLAAEDPTEFPTALWRIEP